MKMNLTNSMNGIMMMNFIEIDYKVRSLIIRKQTEQLCDILNIKVFAELFHKSYIFK